MSAATSFRIFFPLFLFLLFFNGCEHKEDQQNPFETNLSEALHQTLPKPDTSVPQKEQEERNDVTIPQDDNNTFYLKGIRAEAHILTVRKKSLQIKNISAPITVVVFFAPWSLPCQSQMPILSRLQHTYAPKIFVMSVLLNPDKYTPELATFLSEYKADFFVSASQRNNAFARQVTKTLNIQTPFPLPTILIYHNGHLVHFYTSAVPEEMLQHDIKRLLK